MFVAEKENNQLRFLDPQRNEEYAADVLSRRKMKKQDFGESMTGMYQTEVLLPVKRSDLHGVQSGL